MVELIPQTRFTDESLKWAEIQGKHYAMHYMRDIAMGATSNLIEHVGVDPEASSQIVDLDFVSYQTESEVIKTKVGRDVTVSNLIPVGEREDNELGLEHVFARVSNSVFYHTVSTFDRSYVRPHWLALKRQEILEVKDETGYRSTQMIVQRFAGNSATDPQQIVAMPNTRKEMISSRLGLDARKYPAHTTKDMATYYDDQVTKLAVFLDEIKDLSDVTDCPIWPQHIAATLRAKAR